MLGIAAEFRSHASRFGARPAAHHLAWRVADRLVGFMPYRGLVLPALRAGAAEVAGSNELPCREVDLRELAACVSESNYELSEHFVSDAGARGDCCFGAFADGKLVSYAFYSSIPTNIDSGFRFRFPEGWVYQFKAFTLPEWRGRRLHPRLVAAAVAKFQAIQGFKGLATLVVATNYPSLASFGRMGFEPAFRFTLVGKGDGRRVLAALEGLSGPFAIEKIAP